MMSRATAAFQPYHATGTITARVTTSPNSRTASCARGGNWSKTTDMLMWSSVRWSWAAPQSAPHTITSRPNSSVHGIVMVSERR